MVSVNLCSNKSIELEKFLSLFYDSSFSLNKDLSWKKNYNNPIEIVEIIGTYADNLDKFEITMWVSIDKDVFINVTEKNADSLIKYIYERFPY